MRWLIRCETCGYERAFEAGFDLTITGGRIYIYCRRCKRNTMHSVVGLEDRGRIIPFNELLTLRNSHRSGDIID